MEKVLQRRGELVDRLQQRIGVAKQENDPILPTIQNIVNGLSGNGVDDLEKLVEKAEKKERELPPMPIRLDKITWGGYNSFLNEVKAELHAFAMDYFIEKGKLPDKAKIFKDELHDIKRNFNMPSAATGELEKIRTKIKKHFGGDSVSE